MRFGLLAFCILFCVCLSTSLSAAENGTAVKKAKALKPGDTIMFVAPSRTPERNPTLLAKKRLKEMGFKVVLPDGVFEKEGYLAGTDQRRADELMKAFTDDEVDAIFPVTGGFGTTRILDDLDYEVISKNPKLLIGFSDITGLHLAIHKKTGLITFHSPNPDFGLGTPENLSRFSRDWFERAILRDRYQKSNGYLISVRDYLSPSLPAKDQLVSPKTMVRGTARGRLIGGNLSLIAALIGTPFEIETEGRILFIEDIGEAPYRVDRMLSTLKLANKLSNLAGVVLGKFTYRSDQDTSIEGRSIETVLADYFSGLGIPVIEDFPVGHHRFNATLPIGAKCEIDANQKTIRLLECPLLLSD